VSGQAGALLALWNDVDPAHEADYNAWHAVEHVPERLTVPGMLWGLRYAALRGTPGPRYLTLYGLRDAQVLESAEYKRLLSQPTPASARMRPQLRNISRWVCRVHAQRGGLDGDWLGVRTFDGADEARVGLVQEAARADTAMLAERLPDAAPLPWMQGGQAQTIDGNWLLAMAGAGNVPPAAPGLRLYAALPCGSVSASAS
jgi:hypothetical protein